MVRLTLEGLEAGQRLAGTVFDRARSQYEWAQDREMRKQAQNSAQALHAKLSGLESRQQLEQVNDEISEIEVKLQAIRTGADIGEDAEVLQGHLENALDQQSRLSAQSLTDQTQLISEFTVLNQGNPYSQQMAQQMHKGIADTLKTVQGAASLSAERELRQTEAEAQREATAEFRVGQAGREEQRIGIERERLELAKGAQAEEVRPRTEEELFREHLANSPAVLALLSDPEQTQAGIELARKLAKAGVAPGEGEAGGRGAEPELTVENIQEVAQQRATKVKTAEAEVTQTAEEEVRQSVLQQELEDIEGGKKPRTKESLEALIKYTIDFRKGKTPGQQPLF